METYDSKPHTHDQASSTIEHLTVTFQQELSRHCFFYCDAEHAKYMRSVDEGIANPPYGRETAQAFTHSLRDMILAGNCLGCGLDDACVFHLMRVLEKGLAALAAVFSEPFKHENWHNVIERIESKIRKVDAAFDAFDHVIFFMRQLASGGLTE